MGSALEKRVKKLEQAFRELPRDKPGHQALYVFIDDKNAVITENEARIAEIRACPKCKDKLVVASSIGKRTAKRNRRCACR